MSKDKLESLSCVSMLGYPRQPSGVMYAYHRGKGATRQVVQDVT